MRPEAVEELDRLGQVLIVVAVVAQEGNLLVEAVEEVVMYVPSHDKIRPVVEQLNLVDFCEDDRESSVTKDQFRVSGIWRTPREYFCPKKKLLFDTRIEISIKFKTFCVQL